MDKFTPGQLEQIRDAAPELLEALRGIAPTLKAQISAGLRWDPMEVDAVFAAIAKATANPSPPLADEV